MPDAGAPEVVRLTIPPDADLRPVVEVAVAALVRRSGRPDEAVKAARQAVRGCLAEVAEAAGRDQIDIEIEVVEQQLDVRVRAGTVQRSVTIPGPPTPPG